MGFSSGAGLGEKWVGRKQRGFSQGICRLCGKARFPVVGLLMICPHRSACAVHAEEGLCCLEPPLAYLLFPPTVVRLPRLFCLQPL